MSLHVTPPFTDVVAARAGEIISSQVIGGATTAHSPVLEVLDSPALPETLSVQLDHMGVVLAITATTGAAAVHVAPTSDDRQAIHLQVAPRSLDHYQSLFLRDASSANRTADPVIERLSRALDAAEASDREFGGLYADALRLAIVARVLGDRTAGEPSPAQDLANQAQEVAHTPRRPKSGLPKWRFKRVMTYIDENLSESVSLAGMAAAAGLSRMHFAAQFRVATGLRPHEFLLRRRVERAQVMMLESRNSLVEVALGVGFQTQAHFTTVFRRFTGDTPYQWRCANRSRN